MSSQTMPSAPQSSPAPDAHRELQVYSHSTLLYWWPVWVVGLLMALWTAIDNYHMVLAPAGTTANTGQLTLPPGGSLDVSLVHVARSPVPGAIFVTTLLAVLVFTHLSLRGVWALFAAACLVALAMLLSWMEWWHDLFGWLRSLRVFLNLGAYLAISVPLLIVWLAALFVFDRQTYLSFSPSQIRLRNRLGSQEKVFDSSAAAFEKRPYDWFRWLVGRGAGDLVIRVGGPQPQTIEMPNVIRIDKWLSEMEYRLRIRDVE